VYFYKGSFGSIMMLLISCFSRLIVNCLLTKFPSSGLRTTLPGESICTALHAPTYSAQQQQQSQQQQQQQQQWQTEAGTASGSTASKGTYHRQQP
jgi:hypothetical protein